ncbi:cytochrome P450 [Lasiosphaeris hirsuta]|uniref:Cytochrome P450 n=1 Tax=Lasiosphaeris hirsuta TaxID=260670 RepID=A0AA39ZRG6_9PEZI|nr:cytochrome P450 [Lasiosphaeris hirsuta]
MASIAKSLVGPLSELAGSSNNVTAIGIGVATALLLLALYFAMSTQSNDPPSLGETIPFLSNSLQMASDSKAFWARALRKMQKLDSEILRFRLAGRRAFLVTGETKTNPLFRTNAGFSSDYYLNLLVDVMFGPTKRDLARFVADVSGRGKIPLPGTEQIAEKDRLWTGWHSIFADNLSRTKPTNELGARFFSNFATRIDNLFHPGDWHTIQVADFLHRHQTECAAKALNGTRVFEENPDYFELLDAFELAIMPIAFGPPKWLNPKPYRARARFLAMNHKYMEGALKRYDWGSPEASSPWEPVFGSPLTRSLVRWGLDVGLDTQTIAGIFGIQVSNQNANSVPASAWAIMNSLVSPDTELLGKLRQEATAATMLDPDTGTRTFDIQKLVAMPWLQAVYTETLRLRLAFSVTRDAVHDTEIDGFRIPKGSMVQAPIPIAHYSAVWNVEGHGTDEFWPRRHLTTVETTSDSGEVYFREEFGIGSRSAYFFPYGGGINICPGRFFAKQEIIGTIALFVAQFEAEVVGWVMHDGSPSDREARNGAGMALSQPDRDLKIRVKRIW